MTDCSFLGKPFKMD